VSKRWIWRDIEEVVDYIMALAKWGESSNLPGLSFEFGNIGDGEDSCTRGIARVLVYLAA
jgi:hypothetical protein